VRVTCTNFGDFDRCSPSSHGEKNARGDVFACFSFHPDMTKQEDKEEINSEVILLIDCSGSMSGSPILSVNEVVKIILKSLPESCQFNIVDFGSKQRSLFKEPKPYTEKTLKEAMKQTEKRNADLGGTELLEPLRNILNSKTKEGYSRQIFLLTDGEVSNSRECIELARTQSNSTRIFTFGIGTSVDKHLVTEIAAVSNGRSTSRSTTEVRMSPMSV